MQCPETMPTGETCPVCKKIHKDRTKIKRVIMLFALAAILAFIFWLRSLGYYLDLGALGAILRAQPARP